MSAIPGEWIDQPGTIDDLLADARALGFPATKRLVYDWTGVGLLDHPKRRSRGVKGGSDKALFPAAQRNLFRLLASKRSEVKYISSLYNVPVFIWLWWDGYVSTHQVQQVMQSWAGERAKKASVVAVRQQARELTNFFDDRYAYSDERAKLIDVLARVGSAGKLEDPGELRQAIRTVFDREDTGRRFGAKQAAISVDAFVTIISARIRGMERARGWVSIKELDTARAIYLDTRWQWERERPGLARDAFRPADEALLKQASLQDLFDRACVDLAFILGLQAQANLALIPTNPTTRRSSHD